GWGGFRRGEIRFQDRPGNRTRIDYNVAIPDHKGLLWGGFLVQALGLIALVVGFWLLEGQVVHSPNPATRIQVVQGVQVCHFLWPPFLFASLYRRPRRALRSAFDAFVHNLPYGDDAPP